MPSKVHAKLQRRKWSTSGCVITDAYRQQVRLSCLLLRWYTSDH